MDSLLQNTRKCNNGFCLFQILHVFLQNRWILDAILSLFYYYFISGVPSFKHNKTNGHDYIPFSCCDTSLIRFPNATKFTLICSHLSLNLSVNLQATNKEKRMKKALLCCLRHFTGIVWLHLSP